MVEQGTPSVSVQIEGKQSSLIIDTGSSISILQPGVSRSEVTTSDIKPYGVTGEVLDVKGRQSLSFELGGKEFHHSFLVCSLPTQAAGILGTDFLKESGAVIDLERKKMTLGVVSATPRVSSETREGRAALTIFTKGREGHSPQPSPWKARQKDEQLPASPPILRDTTQYRTWLIKAKENITMAPRCRQVVIAKLKMESKEEPPLLVCVEPAQIPIEGVLPARALTRVGSSVSTSAPATSRADCAESRSFNTHVLLANFSNETLTIPKATVLGLAEEVSEALIDKINAGNESGFETPTKSQRQKENDALYQKLLSGKLNHLPLEDKQQIEPVLRKYAHVFHDEDTNDFKGTNVIEHQILVGDAQPIRRPQYRTPYALRNEMQRQVQDMLDKNVIRESQSPWSAPAILVPKKSLDGKPKYRFCVDFRALNAVTKFDSYPLPTFEETTSTLHGSQYFTVLDCYSGFWQVSIKEEHRERTGFTVPSGHYEFNRLPFGLSNSPSNFQRLMDVVLKNLVGTECYVFIDDLIIFSSTAEEHALRLENVLRRLDEANLQLHPGKCVFAQPKVQYLGYVLSERGISASPDKVKAVREYPTPKTVKDVRAFLGLASFYRRLVQNFAEVAKPLTILTRKNREFTWGPEQQQAFQSMKDKLCTTHVLAYPNFKLPFILTTDASMTAVGAILSQVQDGAERPTAYASRQLNKAEQAYSATEVEMLALVWATKYFRCYTYGKQFLVRTDHSALTYLRKFADHNSRLLRWSLRLSELDFVVEHRAGSKIGHVDALSRHVGAITHPNSLSKEVVLREQKADTFCCKQNPGTIRSRSEFFIDDAEVMYRRQKNGKHQLVVPRTLIQEVIKENHDPKYVAHPGMKRTYSLIALNYWWPIMRRDIEDYIRKCDPCQRRKEGKVPIAPLGEVPSPKFPFEITAMDLTGPYVTTPRGNKYLLTFIDHFSRYVEAFPVPDQTAETCARIYATQIVTRHGTGSTLITDQGPAFMSSFFQGTCKILGVRRLRTSSYHPQSNGVIERFHKSLHEGLSHYINSTNTNWDTLVPFYLMSSRATPHSSTGFSPFYLLHGREMVLPNSDDLKAKLPQDNPSYQQRLENLRSNLKLAYELVAKANKRSHDRNRQYYDRKTKLRKFQMNDLVYLYNPAKKPGLSRKFWKPWQGLYKVTKKLSDLNYEVTDQYGKKRVVHVNRLKGAYASEQWKTQVEPKTRKQSRKGSARHSRQDEEEYVVNHYPIVITEDVPSAPERENAARENPETPDTAQSEVETPSSELRDPSYHPSDTPKSRRELQATRTQPPLTRSRARMMSNECIN